MSRRSRPSSRAALAKSGTVTLELALAGVPMVTAYRVTEIEAFIARRVIQTSSIILANLILGENVIPEFLQQDFTAEKLAPALRDVLGDTPARQRQVDAFARLEEIMSTGGKRPSELAADGVIATLVDSVPTSRAKRSRTSAGASTPDDPIRHGSSFSSSAATFDDGFDSFTVFSSWYDRFY